MRAFFGIVYDQSRVAARNGDLLEDHMLGDGQIKIGTRASRLALIQSEYVKGRIEAGNPGVRIRLVTVKTTADRIQNSPLYRIGGKGLFLKEIEEALLKGEIDMAVHSMKDVPSEIPPPLEIAAITEREDPRDALITKGRLGRLDEMAQGATVATSSLRRSSQLLHVRPDLRIVPMRGNQDTRLRKLKSQDIDGIVLAMAGIRRMNFGEINILSLEPDICLPAGGQGSLGIEIRRDCEEIREMVSPLNHSEASINIRAERACLKSLGAECYTSMAAFAETLDSKIHLRAVVADLEGARLVKKEMMGDSNDPEALGRELASRLLGDGAEEIIEEIKRREALR
jgi:hydroxymethylbilane synthase